MHGVAPRVIKGKAWWDAKRQEAYKSTNYHCAACGVHKSRAKYHQWLEAHELYDLDYLRGRMVLREIVPLCHSCHNYIHSGRMRALVAKGEFSPKKRRAIHRHGDIILDKAKLTRKKYSGVVADWGKWRMVIDGEEYPPKCPSFREWKRVYWLTESVTSD